MKKFKLLTVAVAAAIAVQVGAMCLFAGCKGGNGEEKPSLTFEIADVTAWIDYPASEISPVFNLEGEHTVTYTTNSDKIRIDGNKVTALAEGEAIVFAEAEGYETDFNVICKTVNPGDSKYYMRGEGWDWANKAISGRAKYDREGTDGKTTVFIGDSFNDIDFFSSFYSFYRDKDALCLGIGGTTSNTWEMFLDERFGYGAVYEGIQPKNVVVQLGNNNIYNDQSSYTEAVEDLQRCLTLMHAKMPDTKIYYFGVTPRIYIESMATLTKRINKAMGKFCENKDWVTFLDCNDTVTPEDIRDNIHLYPASYQIFVDALKEAGMVVEDK